MTLAIQKYLRAGSTIEELNDTRGINAKRHHTYQNLVLFKYDQIDSPMADPIVQECRGIILDEANDWNVVARAFDKFFNYGEGHAPQINWKTARVQEKVDGSLCLLFHYREQWHIATTGTPDASGGVNNQELTFADLFWQTLGTRFDQNDPTAKNFCFIFELTGPLNRVVVPHAHSDLTLLGARNTTDWKEVHPSSVSNFFPGVSVVKEFPLQSIDEIVATFATMSPLQQEGYVIVWINENGIFERVKDKHPGYVALHHAKSGMTTKAFVEVVRSGECSEVISAFPEFKPMLDEAQLRYNVLLAELEIQYGMYRNVAVQKDFAIAIKDSKYSGALFALRAGKVKSIREFLSKVNIDNLMDVLGY